MVFEVVVVFEVAVFEAVDSEEVPQVSEWGGLGLVEDHLGELVPAE